MNRTDQIWAKEKPLKGGFVGGLLFRALKAHELNEATVDLIEPNVWPSTAGANLSVECVEACAAALNALAERWKRRS